MMKQTRYWPYIGKEEAIAEYKTLRAEIMESQKQRVTLFHLSIGFIVVLFGIFIKDNNLTELTTYEAFILIFLLVASNLFSYSTRCRERRIATYIAMALKTLLYWSDFTLKKKLGFLQRTSTVMVSTMFFLNLVFLYLSLPSCKQQQAIYIAELVLTIFNVIIIFLTYKLSDFSKGISEFLNDLEKKQKKGSNLHS